MMHKFFFRMTASLAALLALWLAWVVAVPVPLPKAPYSIAVGANRTLGQVARALDQDGMIRNRWVMVALMRISGTDRKVKAGLYEFSRPVAMWEVLRRFAQGNPDQASVTAIEGWTFRQFRQALASEPDLQHVTASWSDEQILREIGASEAHPEGLFFPSTYFYVPGSSDLEVYRRAYRTMQQQLESIWLARRPDLPYASPYELLIMASLVEKETSRESDRAQVAAVFLNRLRIGMRLQTDPAVIYGMGASYQGNIGKAGLRRDTPYNTYTRSGLTPTPIALPGRAALDAAAHPADTRALYFVARGDGTTHFSETLDEHNGAVRQFILKKGS
ncbi:endolytic transglycosylase MltG [Pseudogulbenkiania ferrooxidans]|uniref:Endolytic murein transglycosylase n=1 Tax=Pseudogulbenkiania ferrooxidans 2002 TaxID=279714 RepID=B9Z1T3_9NEIS|nr:endolytic transglycosylase MltG [Pseudogulbenkiania ferrooxidans]EEG09378.1 aminodeoxychorismate lyase [Pseudogulbenkiania ferrooxidans 2002]